MSFNSSQYLCTLPVKKSKQFGYDRVRNDDQVLDLQLDALIKTRCAETYIQNASDKTAGRRDPSCLASGSFNMLIRNCFSMGIPATL